MADNAQTLKIEIKVNYPMFFGLVMIAHVLLFVLLNIPEIVSEAQKLAGANEPIKVRYIGKKDGSKKNTVFLKDGPASMPSVARQKTNRPLNLSDLTAAQLPKPTTQSPAVTMRPGQIPNARGTALSGLRYGADDFRKMTKDPMYQGGTDLINSQRVSLNFEVPEGQNIDQLNDSELRLYGFLKRGAMKYVNSVSAEIKDFELKNPHLHFPLTESKQVMTGRLTYDGQGNLKQIKMVRWTNIDKLQSFFENVVKRMETLQNPPKELWVENQEFTIFITLQING